MSIFINNKKILGTEPPVNIGDLGLFAGVDDQFYVKKSDGSTYALGSGSASSITSVEIINNQLIFTEANGATFGASGSFTSVSSSTQSFTLGFPLFNDLFDYALNISGTYSDFTYVKTNPLTIIVNSQDLNVGTLSNSIGATSSIYNGLISVDLTGGTNYVDVSYLNLSTIEGPVPADDVTYQYFLRSNIGGYEYHYEFIEMATHSNIRYAHYFNITNITGRSGGAIELDFDGVTVTKQFGSNSLFGTNVP
jgi:hypothetical protein